MFSGIIETLGKISHLDKKGEELSIVIDSSLPLTEIRLGDSIAVNGCCLTVTEKIATASHQGSFQTYASPETLKRTNLGQIQVGSMVNLERSLTLGHTLDGHLLQGHVEAQAKLVEKKAMGDSVEISLRLPRALAPLVVEKGSIAVDGVSLTINRIEDGKDFVGVNINLIPHTLSHTTFGQMSVGALVNIETDIIGRYVQRYLDLTVRK